MLEYALWAKIHYRLDQSGKMINPPVTPDSLLTILKCIREVPSKATADDINKYLDTCTEIKGVRIPTLICMLAREKRGRFPPIDKKIIAGLKKLKKIDNKTANILASNHNAEFSKCYVKKVIPAWEDLRKKMNPKEADEYLMKAGFT